MKGSSTFVKVDVALVEIPGTRSQTTRAAHVVRDCQRFRYHEMAERDGHRGVSQALVAERPERPVHVVAFFVGAAGRSLAARATRTTSRGLNSLAGESIRLATRRNAVPSTGSAAAAA